VSRLPTSTSTSLASSVLACATTASLHRAYVALYNCIALQSVGDLALQQPRFPDAGMASPNHKEIHALQSLGDHVLQQPRFPNTGRALPNHKEIHALQSFRDLVPGRRLWPARPRVPRCLRIFARVGPASHTPFLPSPVQPPGSTKGTPVFLAVLARALQGGRAAGAGTQKLCVAICDLSHRHKNDVEHSCLA